MTTAAVSRAISYAENGVTVEFSVPFKFLANTDIKALRRDAEGVETVLAYGVDYSVAGAGVAAGGTLTVTTAAASGNTLSIWSETARGQLTDYATGDTFPAESHEAALDRLDLVAQEQDTEVARAPQFPRSVTKRDFADGLTVGEVLFVDGDGKIGSTENSVTGAAASATAAAESAAAASDDADATAADAATVAADKVAVATDKAAVAADRAAVETAAAGALAAGYIYSSTAAGVAARPTDDDGWWLINGDNLDYYTTQSSAAQDEGFSLAGTGVVTTAITALDDASTAFSAQLLNAQRGGTIAETGLGDYALTYKVDITGMVTTGARWSKFWDAGASTTDELIAVGTIVEAVTLHGAGQVSSKVRARIWRRPLTSADLNVGAGEGADDVMLADTGLIDVPDTWPALTTGVTSTAFPLLPVDDFVIEAGYSYGIEYWYEDGAGALVVANAQYKQIGTGVYGQRILGHYYNGAAAGGFSVYSNARMFCFGFGVRATKDIEEIERKAERKVPATVATSLLTDMERRVITEGGAWSETLKRPSYPAYRHGIGRLGITSGAYGVDFGPRVAEADMADLKLEPRWVSATKRLLLNGSNANDPDGYLFEEGVIDDGFVDISSGVLHNVTLRDCIIRGIATGPTYGIQQTSTDNKLTVEHCLIELHKFSEVLLRRGVLRNSMFAYGGQNGVNAQNSAPAEPLLVEQCLFYLAGWIAAGNADPHGDLWEENGVNNTSICASTFYLPASATLWDATLWGGPTNLIRHACSGTGQTIQKSYVMGNAMFGANPAMTINPRYDGCTANEFFRLFNKYGSIADYANGSGHLYLPAPESGTVSWGNVVVFDEYGTDGTAYGAIGDALPASYAARPADAYRTNEEKWGIFDYDKTTMSDKGKEILWLLGKVTGRTIIDDNADLNSDYDLGNLRTVPV